MGLRGKREVWSHHQPAHNASGASAYLQSSPLCRVVARIPRASFVLSARLHARGITQHQWSGQPRDRAVYFCVLRTAQCPQMNE